MTLAVHLRSAVSVLGRFPVLTGVTLDADAGEVVLVKGANGAGKTSLLRVCAGLLPLVSGEAVVLGRDLRKDRRSIRRRVGLLTPNGFLYDDLTAEENVRFAARAGAGAAHGDVSAALARLGVDGRLARVPATRLSSGQRRRVALAALVARRPSLWLLDEPHAGLDSDGREILDDLVRQAAAEGATVMFASHETEGTEALADRVVVMAGGRMVSDQDDTAAAREPLHVA